MLHSALSKIVIFGHKRFKIYHTQSIFGFFSHKFPTVVILLTVLLVWCLTSSTEALKRNVFLWPCTLTCDLFLIEYDLERDQLDQLWVLSLLGHKSSWLKREPPNAQLSASQWRTLRVKSRHIIYVHGTIAVLWVYVHRVTVTWFRSISMPAGFRRHLVLKLL